MAFKVIDPGMNVGIDQKTNGIGSNILKTSAIGGTGLAAGALGIIPAITSALASGGQYLSEILNPEDVESRELLGKVKGIAEKGTPEKLQEYAGKLTGGYLTPETKIQKGVSEVTQDIGGFIGFGSTAFNAAKIAAFGNTAKQAVKRFGGSEGLAETAKLFGMMSSPLFKFNKIKSLYRNLYSDARLALDKAKFKSVVKSKPIYDSAKNVFNETLEGTGKSTAKIAARKMVKGALSKIKKNKIPVKEVWEMSKDINNELAKMGKYTEQKARLLSPFRKTINNALDIYGKKNKDFGYAFKNAQTLFGIEKGLPLLDKAINKVVGLKDTGVAEYFRKSMAWGFGGLKGLFAKQYLGSLSKRGEAFLRSPAYRQESIKLAKATIKSSLPATISSVKKLKSIYDQNKKGKFTVIKV